MPLDKSPAVISSMFDALAYKYDLMNDLMSVFSHRRTRKFALKLARFNGGKSALDLATGTGDFALLLHSSGGSSSRVTGIDLSERMLAVARVRAQRQDIANGSIDFLQGDISALPFPKDSFDVCTTSYGIRNVQDIYAVLVEVLRVTKPGGTFVIVEATPPVQPVIRFLVNFHFSRIVPLIARLFSSSAPAYDYFVRSVAGFPYPDDFASMMERAGWIKVRFFPKLLGSVTVFQGFKKK